MVFNGKGLSSFIPYHIISADKAQAVDGGKKITAWRMARAERGRQNKECVHRCPTVGSAAKSEQSLVTFKGTAQRLL